MKITLLYVLRIIFMALAFLFRMLTYLSGFFMEGLEIMLRYLRMRIYKLKKRSKQLKSDSTVLPQTKPVTHTSDGNIIGSTRTRYLVKLPEADADGCFHHQPLEKEVPQTEEEPDIDPNDVDCISTDTPLRDVLSEEDPDLSPDSDSYPSDLSSGVTIEELNETYDTLSRHSSSKEEETKAHDVLSRLDGTVMLDFFMLQKECEQKAKRLMDVDTVSPSKDIPDAGHPIGDAAFDLTPYVG